MAIYKPQFRILKSALVVGQTVATMSATFQVQSQGSSPAQRQLLQLANPDFQQELLESVGALVESQTLQRIQEHKTGPDGNA